ncbi:hypothetical protein CEJ45_01945 [Herbaspirillum aquaticum]|uniref:Uncharacterized protein n=1 Tax=Herbaspirillum aquaticum TaxID=568783 RepID=A0A225SZY5_9BURK|nr:hypothetical protein CEJ45_01945 [Herbaspirillum aquaticum]
MFDHSGMEARAGLAPSTYCGQKNRMVPQMQAELNLKSLNQQRRLGRGFPAEPALEKAGLMLK